MPNKRHPAREYIGFWGTNLLKKKLEDIASKRGISLSMLVLQVLWDFVNGVELLLFMFPI